ncbi:MAG: hypothetical protein K8L97_33540 [Anaerolineae bacterium]|nr:hypothetical protein [Anaerolineae bacterium]
MPEGDGIEFPIGLDLTNYTRSINTAITQADDLDTSLDRVAGTAQDAEKALNALTGTVDVDVTVDTTDVGTAATAIAALSDDQSLKVTVDKSEVTTAVDDVGKLSATQATTVTVDTIDVTTAQNKIDRVINAAARISGRVLMSSSDVDAVKSKVDELKQTSLLNLTLNVAGSLPGILSKLEELTVAPILETQDAIAGLDARTRGALPNVEALINGLNAEGLGESRTAIAGVLEEGIRLNIPEDQFADAARGALQVTEAFTDQDPVQVLSTMNTLVAEGLVPNFRAAADLVTTGFQEFGTGFDFLGLIGEYKAELDDFSISGTQALNLIKTGMESGFPTPEQAFESLREFQNMLNAAVSDPEGDTSVALAQLGFDNPAAMGEQASIEFFQGVIDGINNNPGEGLTQQQLTTALFGSPGEDFSTSILGLDANANPFSDLTGAAEEAATTINDSLTQQLDIFFRYVQDEAVNFMSSEQIDLPGKIEAIKTGLSDAIAVLKDGGTLGEAVEVGLKPLGFDDEFAKLESIFGNLVISFLGIVAGLQEALPGGSDGSEARAEISRLARQQLEFDLQLENPEDITNAIRAARGRGVEDEVIGQIAQTAVDDALAAGDVAQAQNIVTGAGATTQTVSAPDLGLLGNFTPFGNLTNQLETEIPVNFGIDTGTLQEKIDMAAGDLREQALAAFSAGDVGIALGFAEQLNDPILLGTISTVAEAMRDTFETAIVTGNVGAATNAAEALNDPELSARLQEYVDSQFGERAVTDLKGTTDAVSTSFTELKDEVGAASDAVQSNAADAEAAMVSLGDTTTDVVSGNTMTDDLALLHTTADERLVPVIDYINTLKVAAIEAGGALSIFGIAGSSAFGGINAAAVGAGNPFDVPGGTTSIPLKAGGGEASGTFIAGEAGPELISSDSNVAVLNNATTRDIYSAVAALVGAQPSINNSNNGRNVTVNQINYVQSSAQQGASVQKIANAVRGF